MPTDATGQAQADNTGAPRSAVLPPKRTQRIALVALAAALPLVTPTALPALLAQARIDANETAALRTLRALSVSNTRYRVRFGAYPRTLGDVFAMAGYQDAASYRAGYQFSYLRTSAHHFQAAAEPLRPTRSGSRYFFVDESGVIRASDSGPAGPCTAPLRGASP